MALLSRENIAELAGIHQTPCISIYIPTHRNGVEVSEGQDSKRLKNRLKEVSNELKKRGVRDSEIEHLLKPAWDLQADRMFWSYQSDGLAIFITNGFFKYYTLPVFFEEFHYISSDFYLKPLLPMLASNSRFFVLGLEIEHVKFYEGTRHSMAEVEIEDLTPGRLEEAVGFDWKEKSLQMRGHHEAHGRAMFHGQSAGKDERKIEIQKYFRAINKGLMQMLHDEHPPMVVACLDYFFSMYKEVNGYKHLFPKHIAKNPADMSMTDLHEKTLEILQPFFEQERAEKSALFQQYNETDRTSFDIHEIIPAAIEGKVDALFLKSGEDIFGRYNPQKNEVITTEDGMENGLGNVSLMNLAAVEVFQQGGKVYLLDQEAMPYNDSKLNALYRY